MDIELHTSNITVFVNMGGWLCGFASIGSVAQLNIKGIDKMGKDEEGQIASAMINLGREMSALTEQVKALNTYCRDNISELWKKHDAMNESHQKMNTLLSVHLREFDEDKKADREMRMANDNPGTVADRKMVYIAAVSLITSIILGVVAVYASVS
jgi:hypothetical protein